ncbi:MAG: RDD family protein [Pseudomonadota bacterium]
MTELVDIPHEEQVRRRQVRLERDADERKRLRDLITPEGAALTLRIASGGERAGAFMIDFTILILTLIAGLFAVVFTAGQFGLGGWQIAGAIFTLFAFTLRNFYFIAFELGRRAATPGKRALGLRVAARNGGRLTANAVFARNFIREIEVFLPLQFLFMGIGADDVSGWIALFGLGWSGVFLFFPLFNKDRLRAGDMIAGTWVIHAPKIDLLADVAKSGGSESGVSDLAGFSFTQEQLTAYGIHELHVLEDVLRNSNDEIKVSVANRIRVKIDWQRGPNETNRAFLEAYYAALRQQLERQLLLGTRKEDKFDKG